MASLAVFSTTRLEKRSDCNGFLEAALDVCNKDRDRGKVEEGGNKVVAGQDRKR